MDILTHLPLDTMAAISLMICSDAFSWMKNFAFWLKFHWRLFLRSNWQQSSIGWDNGLALNRRQAIIWINADPIYWRMCGTRGRWVNSFVPQRCESNFKSVIFNPTSWIWFLSHLHEITLGRTPKELNDDKSTLVQVMVWFHQATSHYLIQCWPKYLLPYGVTRP